MSLSTVSTNVVLTTLLGASSTSLGQVVLMDQIGADDGSSIDTSDMLANQLFEASFSIYSVAAIDDFDNPIGIPAASVDAVIGGWNGYVGIDGIIGLSANFYSSPDAAGINLVGDVSNQDVAGTPSGDPNWTLAGYDLVGVAGTMSNQVGTNYASLIPNNEFGTNGQTGMAIGFEGDLNAWQANPGGGFGFGAVQVMPNNMALRVMGLDADCNDNGIPDEDEIAADPSLDCNSNGWLDTCEVDAGHDCNANGIVDECDIADGSSTDCNGNGVPDECDVFTDCNNNGIEDSCDIADGSSTDCDDNGIPDECDAITDCNDNDIEDACDIAGGTSVDCDDNGIPDECDAITDCNDNGIEDACDIADGTSVDCDDNGIPDECEPFIDCNENGLLDACDIDNGTSLDCDGNGIPDECEDEDKVWCDCNSNGIPDYEEIEADPTLDCNANGWLDECELEEGNDCNANGVVDACDIAEGQSEDCNGNGVPDMCEIDNGSAQDCNNNLVPDGCDITDGTSQDLDGDGVPDECPLECASAVFRPGLVAPSADFDSMGWHMDVGDGVLAATARRDGRWHVLLYDALSLEHIAAIDMRMEHWGTTIIGNQLAVGDGFVAVAYTDAVDDGSPGVVITERVSGSWVMTTMIPTPEEDDIEGFGFGVAATGNRLAVSDYYQNTADDSAAVYVYHRTGVGSWVLEQTIEASGDQLVAWWGTALAMDEDWLAIASPMLQSNGLGEVDLYAFDGTSYQYHSTVMPEGVIPDGASWGFGEHLSMADGVLVIGAGDVSNWNSEGWVEVHRWDGDAWVFEAQLHPEGLLQGEVFGANVHIQGDRVCVGATRGEVGGAAYVFDRGADGVWRQRSRINDPLNEGNDYFGAGCAVAGNAVIVGEPYMDDLPPYLHAIGIAPSLDPSDCNGNGICDGLDLAGGTDTDCDGSGVLDQCEIDARLVADVDGNGIPDLCELDCDGDGSPDAYELDLGSGFDCNANGQLDNCDIASGQSPDGDGDGVPDECDPGFVIMVAADGSGMFSELQVALDLSVPGSRIEVQPGVYSGLLVFPGHNVHLVGLQGSAATVIDGEGSGSCVFIGPGHDAGTLLEGFTLRNGVGGIGGGVLIVGASPIIRSCTIESCTSWAGGGIGVMGGSPTLDALTLHSNHADRGGGLWIGEGSVFATDCAFTDNHADHGGGAVCVSRSTDQILADLDAQQCAFQGNTSLGESLDEGGGAILLLDGSATLQGCMVDDNSAIIGGGIEVVRPSTLVLLDGLVTNNVAELTGGGIGITSTDETDVEVGGVYFCQNDPQDFSGVYTDLGGNILSADCNGNGICDLEEILDGSATDCNANYIPDSCEAGDCNDNGVNDVCDIENETSIDLDEDGVPDECQDCNENGVPDFLDIDFGTSEDCNGNDVPDECDIADGTSMDCNVNGVPDQCDITSGDSTDVDDNGVPDECDPDCNGNGLPDAWDLSQGISEDCNGNSTPDECDIADGESQDADGSGVPDECEPGWVVHVGPGGYGSIQNAIDAALDGNIIEIASGTWSGPIDLTGRTLVLRSADVAAGTTIDGMGEDTTILIGPGSTIELQALTIAGGGGALGSGVRGVDADMVLTECIIQGNVGQRGGGVAATGGNLTIVQCWIHDNTALLGGGGVYHDGGQALIATSTIQGNDSGTAGGAVRHKSGEMTIQDCWVGENVANIAGGVDAYFAPVTFVNCTILGNVGKMSVGGIRCASSEPLLSPVQDCAFCINDPTDIVGYWDDLGGNTFSGDCDGNGRCDAEEIASGDANDCDGNGLPDACDGDCNDNGFADSCDILDGTSADVNDNGIPDECEDDCNENGIPDDWELAQGAPDCNANGLLDECDIDMGVSLDCNVNTVPDECDIDGGYPDCDGDGVIDTCNKNWMDCNENGVYDQCDIASGAPDCDLDGVIDTCNADWGDCDGNGVYDQCDIAGPDGDDCNENGILDSCDIADESSPDYNENGIPDECEPDCNENGFPDFIEIKYGWSEDCNLNGVPDECDIANGTSEDVDGDGIPDECSCPDIDGDGSVGTAEILLILSDWGTCEDCPADFNGDGLVNTNDLLFVIASWGPCP